MSLMLGKFQYMQIEGVYKLTGLLQVALLGYYGQGGGDCLGGLLAKGFGSDEDVD